MEVQSFLPRPEKILILLEGTFSLPLAHIVEGILNHRKIRNRIQYLVKWQGYHDATWVPEFHLKDESGNDIIALQHYKASI